MSERADIAFDNALGVEDSAWHEYNLQIATEVLSEFSMLDWEGLQAIVLSKPAYWQERCAESVGGIESDESVRILTVLLGTPYMSVAGIVASQLDDFSVRLPLAYECVLRNILAYLDENKSTRSADVRRLIDHLY